jgi:phage recombination protein Bet
MAQALTIAPRMTKPAIFSGTDATWRTLNDLYPAAETPEIIMAVLDYCNIRKLDPFKRPVHIVPMYNSKLRRKVQVCMPGIAEVMTTAARSKAWAGMDAPVWGEWIEQTFSGPADEESGETKTVKVRYPESCKITAYRLVGGERRAFTEELFWVETYARVGFRSAMPNDRWAKAPSQMLAKCTKAAVLRTAFPEDITDYTAEEMEDKETDFGGVTIEGETHRAEREQDRPIVETREQRERRRMSDEPQINRNGRGVRDYEGPAQTVTGGGAERTIDHAGWELQEPYKLEGLDTLGGDAWLKELLQLLTSAKTLDEVVAIGGHRSVSRSLQVAPTTIKAIINDALRAAHARLAAPEAETGEAEEQSGGYEPSDAQAATDGIDLEALLAEVRGMSAERLAGLGRDAVWRAKMSDLFPPDHAKIIDAVAARKAELEHAK